MKIHWMLWIAMAIIIIAVGAVDRGREDLLFQKGVKEGLFEAKIRSGQATIWELNKDQI